jgi:hypothetical protein
MVVKSLYVSLVFQKIKIKPAPIVEFQIQNLLKFHQLKAFGCFYQNYHKIKFKKSILILLLNVNYVKN